MKFYTELLQQVHLFVQAHPQQADARETVVKGGAGVECRLFVQASWKKQLDWSQTFSSVAGACSDLDMLSNQDDKPSYDGTVYHVQVLQHDDASPRNGAQSRFGSQTFHKKSVEFLCVTSTV